MLTHSLTFLHLINAPPFQEDIVMLGIRNNTKNSLILRTLRERGATNGSGRLPTAAQVTAHHFYLNSNQWIDHFSSLSLPKKWNHWPPILLVQMITINIYICRWESRKDIWRGGWKRIAAQKWILRLWESTVRQILCRCTILEQNNPQFWFCNAMCNWAWWNVCNDIM